jgi:signal transduction histidine kinase
MRPAAAQGLPDEALREVNRLWTIVRAFSNAAHDVNNALQVIAGSAELIEAREIDPVLRRRVEAIRAQAGRAASSIDRLLSYSRGSGEGRRTVDVSPVLDSAVAMRSFALGRARIQITVERVAAEPFWAVIDRNRTLQAFLDMLLWAEEMVRTHGNGRIRVHLDRDAHSISLSVTAIRDESGNGEEPVGVDRTAAIAAVTTDAQIWAAAQLVAADKGTLFVSETGESATLKVSLPAAQASA